MKGEGRGLAAISRRGVQGHQWGTNTLSTSLPAAGIYGEVLEMPKMHYRDQKSVPLMKMHELFDAKHGVKKRCQTWHRSF